MSPFTIFVLCIQALLIQVNFGAAKRYTLVNGPSTVAVYIPKLPCEPVLVPASVTVPTVTSQQCGCGPQYGYSCAPAVGYSAGYSTGSSVPSNSYGGYSSGYSTGSSVPSTNCGSYGGKGTGEVGVTGTIDACGNTCIKGTVPVLGSVDFEGCADACGVVKVCGQCGCNCN